MLFRRSHAGETTHPGRTRRSPLRPLISLNHFMIFASAAIVTGITAYFVHLEPKPHSTHIIYQLVIVSTFRLSWIMATYVKLPVCLGCNHAYPIRDLFNLAIHQQISRPFHACKSHFLLPVAHLVHLRKPGLGWRKVCKEFDSRRPVFAKEDHHRVRLPRAVSFNPYGGFSMPNLFFRFFLMCNVVAEGFLLRQERTGAVVDPVVEPKHRPDTATTANTTSAV